VLPHSLVWIFMSHEAILAIRTWAVWGRNRSVGVFLAILMLGNLISQCVIVNKFMRSLIRTSLLLLIRKFSYAAFTDGPPLYSGFRDVLLRTLI